MSEDVQKTEVERLEEYEANIEGMGHRALVKELARQANRHYEGKGFTMKGEKLDFSQLNARRGVKHYNRAGLGNAEATVLKIVLENTQTANHFDKKRRARKDQIGSGKMHAYPV